jgi:large conductance mechanosensitive channel
VLKEFKEFAMRPTLIEVAIGLVMALALAALVNSLVEHIVMPIVGIIFGEPSFDSVMILTINDSQIRIGSFLTAIVAFLSIAFAVFFFIIKPYKAYLAKQEEPEAEPEADPEDLVLLREIRDALRTR